MAGAGFKTFAVGDVLTAGDVNTYLMEQAVMTFADSGARGSAIGTATEGMLSYLADTDAVEVYDGSAWVSVGAAEPTSGDVIGMAGTVTAARTTGTTLIPADGTKPQITEGVQYYTLSYTPKRSDTRLYVLATLTASETANIVDQFTVALFQDSTADCLDAAFTTEGSGGIDGFWKTSLVADVASTGAGTATTFQVRGGGNITGSTGLNYSPTSVNGWGTLGDPYKSGMTIVEYLP